MTEPLTLVSLSAAMDGGLTAIAEVSDVLAQQGMATQSRLIGGVTVLLHQLRLGLDLPLRATADADYGLTPYLLQDRTLISALEDVGYTKVFGNRWERPLDATRVAAVDLLVPSYRTRARDTVHVGHIVTTEVPGLAEALRRPGIDVDIDMVLTDTLDDQRHGAHSRCRVDARAQGVGSDRTQRRPRRRGPLAVPRDRARRRRHRRHAP